MKRVLGLILFAAAAGTAAWQGASALQSSAPSAADKAEAAKKASPPKPAERAEPKPAPKPAAAKPVASAPKPANPAAKPAAPIKKAVTLTGKAETPMAQRVATIGLLNKRNGLWRDLTLKPGEGVRIGDVVVRLRACEKTANWEQEQWTGAFVQVITRQSGDTWRKSFSGWLFKESPSINVVEHPIYDVWVKECQMVHPEIGPDTIIARGDDPQAKASKSGRETD